MIKLSGFGMTSYYGPCTMAHCDYYENCVCCCLHSCKKLIQLDYTVQRKNKLKGLKINAPQIFSNFFILLPLLQIDSETSSPTFVQASTNNILMYKICKLFYFNWFQSYSQSFLLNSCLLFNVVVAASGILSNVVHRAYHLEYDLLVQLLLSVLFLPLWKLFFYHSILHKGKDVRIRETS